MKVHGAAPSDPGETASLSATQIADRDDIAAAGDIVEAHYELSWHLYCGSCCDWRRCWRQVKVDYRERTSPASWLWANDGLHLTLIARPVQTIACHY